MHNWLSKLISHHISFPTFCFAWLNFIKGKMHSDYVENNSGVLIVLEITDSFFLKSEFWYKLYRWVSNLADITNNPFSFSHVAHSVRTQWQRDRHWCSNVDWFRLFFFKYFKVNWLNWVISISLILFWIYIFSVFVIYWSPSNCISTTVHYSSFSIATTNLAF